MGVGFCVVVGTLFGGFSGVWFWWFFVEVEEIKELLEREGNRNVPLITTIKPMGDRLW